MAAVDLVQKALAPVALGVLALFPPETPMFSGRYRYLESESENAREKLHKAMEGRHPGGMPGGGPRGMGGGAMGRGSEGGGGRPRGGGPGGGGPNGGGELRSLLEPPKAMTVTHTAHEIAIVEEDGRLRTLHPDGQSYKAEGGAVEVKTRWDGARLIVETKTGRGPKVSEAWSYEPSTSRLTIETTLELSGQPPVTIRSVFERLAAEAS